MKFFACISVNAELSQNLYVSNKFFKQFNKTAIKLLTDNQNYKAVQYEVLLSEFYVLFTVHPGMILVNNQLDTQFFLVYLFLFSSWLFTRIVLSALPGTPGYLLSLKNY